MSGRVFKIGFFAVFAVSSVAAFIWARGVTQGVRVTAERTDVQIRTLAWAALAYADANEGHFPRSAEALKSVGTAVTSLRIHPAGADRMWPTSRDEALKGADPADIDASMRSIVIAWGPDDTIPPYLKPDGLPTMVGTNDEVNGWLDAFRTRGRADGPDEDGAAGR